MKTIKMVVIGSSLFMVMTVSAFASWWNPTTWFKKDILQTEVTSGSIDTKNTTSNNGTYFDVAGKLIIATSTSITKKKAAPVNSYKENNSQQLTVKIDNCSSIRKREIELRSNISYYTNLSLSASPEYHKLQTEAALNAIKNTGPYEIPAGSSPEQIDKIRNSANIYYENKLAELGSQSDINNAKAQGQGEILRALIRKFPECF